MDVTIERQDGVLSARVGGCVDSINAIEFKASIRTAIEEGGRAVAMDLEKLYYISSTGLRAVLLIAETLWNRDAKFVPRSLSEPIREVFEISGFDKVITIHPSRVEALASLDG